MNNLPLFLIAKLLVLIGTINDLAFPFFKILVLAVMPLDLQARSRFRINVCHVVGASRNGI